MGRGTPFLSRLESHTRSKFQLVLLIFFLAIQEAVVADEFLYELQIGNTIDCSIAPDDSNVQALTLHNKLEKGLPNCTIYPQLDTIVQSAYTSKSQLPPPGLNFCRIQLFSDSACTTPLKFLDRLTALYALSDICILSDFAQIFWTDTRHITFTVFDTSPDFCNPETVDFKQFDLVDGICAENRVCNRTLDPGCNTTSGNDVLVDVGSMLAVVGTGD